MREFEESFKGVVDPRAAHLITHPLLTLIGIVILALICGAEGWDEIEQFAECKEPWLRTFLDLSSGLPSADTYRRVFAAILPSSFQKSFAMWAQSLVSQTEGKLVAIDGKRIHGSKEKKKDKQAIVVVRAWVRENHLVFGQWAAKNKSNERTALPELLELLSLKGAMITMDAQMTLKPIARQILDKEADYMMAVKGNQPTLQKQVQKVFEGEPALSRIVDTYVSPMECKHGRQEKRQVWTCSIKQEDGEMASWPGAKSAIRVDSERTVRGKTSYETRYFIASRLLTAEQAADAIRGHWSIENSCHWTLDVGFREDDIRIRDGHAPENLSLVRSVALNLLKQDKTCKMGIKAKQKICGWRQDYLLHVLTGKISV